LLELASPAYLAAPLAWIGAAAFVCALFYPSLAPPPLTRQRSAVFEALLRGVAATDAMRLTRNVRRAQETALQTLAGERRPARDLIIRRQLAAAGLNWTVARFTACRAALAMAVFAVVAPFVPLAAATLIGAAAARFVPKWCLAALAERRRHKFLAAFAAAVEMIVRGAKSGLSLMDCLAIVATDAEEPVRQEFEAILSQLRAGVPLTAAVERLSGAMPAPEVRFFALIMAIQSQTGGNLTVALGNLAGVLRDRQKLAVKVRIASAEARISAMIIAALPFGVIGATAMIAPDYIAMLWKDPSGRKLAGACAVWLALGIVVIRRMAKIEP
jgi:tight adherence protein B